MKYKVNLQSKRRTVRPSNFTSCAGKSWTSRKNKQGVLPSPGGAGERLISDPHSLRQLRVFHVTCYFNHVTYRSVYHNITFCPRFQEALAQAIEHELKLLGTKDSYWTWLVDTLHSKRDDLAKMVRASGMIPIIPEGGYFMLADTSPLS